MDYYDELMLAEELENSTIVRVHGDCSCDTYYTCRSCIQKM